MRISDWSSDVCSSDLLALALVPTDGFAWEKGPTWRGTQIAATADPIPVRDLRGRDVKHRDYSKGQKPVRPPIDNPKPPEEGFWIGPSITVGAGDYLPRDRSQLGRASCRERVCQYV